MLGPFKPIVECKPFLQKDFVAPPQYDEIPKKDRKLNMQ
jgi:hypothetical protein